MADKYEEMARQMRADGVSEKMIARFVAEEMEEDEFRRSKGVTEIEALREWKKIPEHIRKLLLANASCHNCGTTEFAPGYTLRMRHGRVSASDHSWLVSPSARAANHISSRRNTSLRIADTSCDEKISCAPFLLTSESLNSRITYRRSFGCSLASSSSTTTVPPRSPSDSRTPLATSGRFRRPNRLETPRGAGISPGRRSRQRTTPPKTAQKSRTMAKSAPISCETAQNPRGRDRGQGRSNRQRRRGRKPQHREKRTSVPCSPVSEAENGLAAPPPGAATHDPHPARHLARPAGKRSGSSSRKQAIHLHRLDSATLLSAYRSLTVISAARQRSMRPAHMSRLAASPLADIAKPPMAGKRSR